MPQIPLGYLKRVLAGAVFGLYTAQLLYMLNPQIPIDAWKLALVTLIYGLLCGVMFGTFLWGLRVIRVRVFGRPDEGLERRHGFGLVVFAAFASAALFWMHRQAYRVYLPADAVSVLKRGATLITLTAILLLILWLVERNATPRVRRVLLVAGLVAIALSTALLNIRRERYRYETKGLVVANIGLVAGTRPVIVVGVRNLPHDWLLTVIGEGGLPFFARAVEESYFTRIEPFPARSIRALWASLSTGQLPHRHGVTGRYGFSTAVNGPGEPFLLLPGGIGFRFWGLIPPIRRVEARLPSGRSLPIWGMFEKAGFSSLVVNWPSTSPASARPATLLVSDRYADTGGAPSEVWPPSLQQSVRDASRERPKEKGLRVAGLPARTTRTIEKSFTDDAQSVALFERLQKERPWALSAVSVNGLLDLTNAVGVSGNDLPRRGAPAGTAVRTYLEWLDGRLATISRDAPDALLVVISPSGPRPPQPPVNPIDFIGTVLDRDPGASDGFVLILGPGAGKSVDRTIARAADIVPTILFAAGLPVARDMDGRVLTEAFDEEFLRDKSLSLIQTYEASRLLVRRESSP